MKLRKRTALLLAMVLLFSVMATGCTKQKELPKEPSLTVETLEKEGYKLVFSDEFEGDKIDTTKWRLGYHQPTRRGGYYDATEDLLFQKDGALTIRTLYKDGPYGEGFYTSWVESCTKDGVSSKPKTEDLEGFAAKYGYFEIRCIVPPAEGIWSAFWLKPDSDVGMSKDDVLGTGEDGVEIDVMESPWYFNGGKSLNQHVLHGDGYQLDKVEASPIYKVPDMYTQFHTYGVLWTENEYIFYVDGRETWRSTHTVEDENLGVSQVPEYMLLTVEVAGYLDENNNPHPGKELVEGKEKKSWCGDPMNNDKEKAYDFIVDYVRVYQKDV